MALVLCSRVSEIYGGVKAKLRAMSVELEGKARTIKQLVAQNRKLKTQVEQTASTASANMKVAHQRHSQTNTNSAERSGCQRAVSFAFARHSR